MFSTLTKYIATAALMIGSASAADEAFQHKATWGNHGTSTALYSPTFETGQDLFTLSVTKLTKTTYTNPATTDLLLFPTGTFCQGFLSPNVNVQNAGSWAATLDLTTTKDITLSSIDLNIKAFGANGLMQANTRTAQMNFSLKSAEGITLATGNAGSNGFTIPANTAAGINITMNTGLTKALQAGNYKLELTCERTTETAGAFFGLQSITLNGDIVPEPASAGLLAAGSLLALLRRRRAA